MYRKNIFHSCKQERHVPGKQSSPCVSNSLCYPSSPTLNPTSTRALWRALSSAKWADPKEECWRWKPDHQESQRTDNQKPYQPRGLTTLWVQYVWFGGFPGGSDGKASACNAGDPGSIPGLGRSPGEGNGNPLQYSCLENSMD